jgi:uncharacterized protein YkwD
MRRATRIGTVLALSLVATLVLGAMAPNAGARTLRRNQMLELMNTKRENKHVTDLHISSRLSRYARQHSRQMAKRGYIFHTRSLASRLRSVRWSIAGENVGAGGGDVSSLFQAFMDSAPHRRNILRRSFKHVGIGMVRRGGYLWVTMDFYG